LKILTGRINWIVPQSDGSQRKHASGGTAAPKRRASSSRHQPQGVTILYEDRDILVVDKSPGLLTISTEKRETTTAYYRLMDYVRKGYAKSRNRIFIVHRLDRDVSGILVFAKTVQAKEYLQERWEETQKKYLAVVHGRLPNKTGTFSSYLAENKARIVYSTSDARKGKLSHTAYRVLKETAEFSLLEIDLITGRKNQIRVHLAENGHPIVGDKKYGEKDATHKRLALHALSISFKHPFTGKQVTFETKVPGYLRSLVR
jgi:tRNA pseudouridine32 synthase/23S rRNA pseudouridine746 synthase/23S rRNA pseudouridine1911/1915/1917 synthase